MTATINYNGYDMSPQQLQAIETFVRALGITGVPIGGSTGQVLKKNSATDGDASWAAVASASGGDALVANPLSQFAATTSAQLFGVLSNKTGTGLAVFGTSPALSAPTGLVKGDVGLGNVDNTADATKNAALVTLTNKTISGAANTLTVLGSQISGVIPIANLATGSPTGSKFVRDDGVLAVPPGGGGGGGDALVANPLSQFAATTSAQLATVLTDETGTAGGFVRATGPTISAPVITGVTSQAGANFTPAAAMGALAIDVTAALNTKSIAVDSTLTFSGTPANSDQWFGLYVKNTDTNPHIITFPSSFSQVTQAARTTCPIPASGELWIVWRYDGSGYKVFGDSAFLNNYAASAGPAGTDDVAKGYGAGSLWYDATGNALYICESNGSSAAVWTNVAGSGAGDMVLASVQTVTGKKTFGSAGAVGKFALAGTTSGSTILDATAVASGTITLPAATDTLVGKATTDTLTNKTYDTAGTGNSFSINGVAVTANTGTGAVARATSPTFVTPVLGVATATSLNGVSISGTGGLVANKTLTVNNSITVAGVDGTTMTFPTVSASVAALNVAQSFTKGFAVTPSALTSGATVNTDASLSNKFTLTLATNATLANPTNMLNGQVLSWKIKNDGSAGHTLAYGNKFKWAGGTAPTHTPAASAVDIITGWYDSTDDLIYASISLDVK